MRKSTTKAVAATTESEELCRCSYCHSFATNILPRLTNARLSARQPMGVRNRKQRGNDDINMHNNRRGVVLLPRKVYRGPFHERQNKRRGKVNRKSLESIKGSSFSYFRVGNPVSLMPGEARQRRCSTGSEFDESACSLECTSISTAQQLVLDKLRSELEELQSANRRLEVERLALFDTMDQHLTAARQRIRARLREESLKRDKIETKLKQHKKRIF
ncbi:uncharacterized protein LOC134177897 isoform X2 [Corticium candelabrum]|uniref:uncharacterized protein LOC134177897 isoform X2 n=1 Tax=Corticium candelabrum TaxID=121492 RepID=UPI002E272ACC|nr:uncharacterized protein LOC134177897 isoform X2 [Corticium candelabrum]